MMVKLAETFGRELSPVRIQMYLALLKDIPRDQLRRGFAGAAKHCKFFPSPADIREHAGEERADDSALLAWVELDRKAAEIGAWQPLELDNPAAMAALRDVFGDWQTYCSECGVIRGAAWHDKQKAFLAAYRRHSGTGPKSIQGLALPSTTEDPMKGGAL
jgi:hypothetical protein